MALLSESVIGGGGAAFEEVRDQPSFTERDTLWRPRESATPVDTGSNYASVARRPLVPLAASTPMPEAPKQLWEKFATKEPSCSSTSAYFPTSFYARTSELPSTASSPMTHQGVFSYPPGLHQRLHPELPPSLLFPSVYQRTSESFASPWLQSSVYQRLSSELPASWPLPPSVYHRVSSQLPISSTTPRVYHGLSSEVPAPSVHYQTSPELSSHRVSSLYDRVSPQLPASSLSSSVHQRTSSDLPLTSHLPSSVYHRASSHLPTSAHQWGSSQLPASSASSSVHQKLSSGFLNLPASTDHCIPTSYTGSASDHHYHPMTSSSSRMPPYPSAYPAGRLSSLPSTSFYQPPALHLPTGPTYPPTPTDASQPQPLDLSMHGTMETHQEQSTKSPSHPHTTATSHLETSHPIPASPYPSSFHPAASDLHKMYHPSSWLLSMELPSCTPKDAPGCCITSEAQSSSDLSRMYTRADSTLGIIPPMSPPTYINEVDTSPPEPGMEKAPHTPMDFISSVQATCSPDSTVDYERTARSATDTDSSAATDTVKDTKNDPLSAYTYLTSAGWPRLQNTLGLESFLHYQREPVAEEPTERQRQLTSSGGLPVKSLQGVTSTGSDLKCAAPLPSVIRELPPIGDWTASPFHTAPDVVKLGGSVNGGTRQKKEHVCHVCQKTFVHRSSLQRHIAADHRTKWIGTLCPVCFFPIARAADLKDHLRTHSGELPFKCRFCSVGFAHRSTVIKHERTHTGAKPYQCGECGKSFSQSGNLLRHRKIHVHSANAEKANKPTTA